MSSNTLMYVPGLRARRAADRRLVDGDQLVEMLEAFDALGARRDVPSPPFRSRRRASTRMSLTSELLPRAGDAGDADERAQRNLDVDVLQIVVRRAEDPQPLLAERPALRRDFDLQLAGQELAGDAAFGLAALRRACPARRLRRRARRGRGRSR